MSKTTFFYLVIALLLTGCSGPDGALATLRPPAVVYETNTAAATQTQLAAENPQPTATSATAEPAENPADPTSPAAGATSPAQPANTPTPTDEPSPLVDAQTLPNGEDYRWVEIATGFVRPTYLTHAGDGSGRIFIVEQRGVIWVIADGEVQATPYLDLRDRVSTRSNEQGLLGLAFHPNYASNGRLFVHYSTTNRLGLGDGDTIVAEYRASQPSSNTADPTSEQIVLTFDQPFDNHNGGQIAFGPDGYLYFGLGDGGRAGDPLEAGQNTNTWLGKILRIDINTAPYVVPGSNPFVGGGGSPEIWAYGLRNPWRFSFDRLTGDLYIGDVGQNQWEEISVLGPNQAGANLGWNITEGPACYSGNNCNPADFVLPAAAIQHGAGDCSITGGYVYRGTSIPALYGVYFFGDYCSGRVWSMINGASANPESELFTSTGLTISSFGQDQAGELYLINHTGNIYQLQTAP